MPSNVFTFVAIRLKTSITIADVMLILMMVISVTSGFNKIGGIVVLTWKPWLI